jgi:hypothetical protein
MGKYVMVGLATDIFFFFPLSLLLLSLSLEKS